MSSINKPERATQDRVIRLFTDTLKYRYLGNWSDRTGNHCIEEGLLAEHLARSGYSPAHISAALHKLRSEALLHGRTLYAANQAVYQLLRYGVSVRVEAGANTETVHLVNWDEPLKNDFAIAEEVTLTGGQSACGCAAAHAAGDDPPVCGLQAVVDSLTAAQAADAGT